MRKMVCCLLLVCLLGGGFWGSQISAQDRRGLTVGDEVKVIGQQGEELLLYKESHALVIGISNYTNGWSTLPGVKKDVEAVKTLLAAQRFNVVVHMDLERNDLDQALNAFINQYGYHPENRLLVYFSGHGHTMTLATGVEMGYIVPADAPNPAEDLQGFLATAIDMQIFESYAKRIQAKHTLFLFDSCFSGSIFALSKAAIPESISYKTAKPVRQFISSGSAEETVPDESVFRQQFISALTGEGDLNEDGYVTGEELGYFLQQQVINYSKGTQHPQYGKIRDSHLDKGDFVFQLSVTISVESPPENEPTAVPAPQIDPEIAMWKLIESSENIQDVEDFLSAFPDGDFARVARLKLKQLQRKLLSLTPTPTPIPTATPVPRPTISQVEQQLAQLLEQGEAYFARQWYTTPEDSNAFAVYREVLKLNPDHELALQRIQQMLDFYQSQAARAEQQGNRQKALQYYQRYLTIAPNDDTIWDKVAELEAPPTPVPATPTPYPTKIPTPTPTPTPRPTVTPIPIRTPTPRPTAIPKPIAGQAWTDPITGMEFVWISEGCFQMGCVSGIDCSSDEKPVHEVCLDGFWMGKYEVTQAEWQKMMGSNPSSFRGDTRPIENVSWNDAQEFIKKLNSRSNAAFRLPSEAEWEYACRAGSQTAYSFGNGSNRLSEYAWYWGNSGKKTHLVGQLKPNTWGLYDMHGNVWEWCADWYNKDAYSSEAHRKRNPIYVRGGSDRVLRGGSWGSGTRDVRSVLRRHFAPSRRGSYVGFRLVKTK